jgi:hypothetical protein
MDRRDFLKATVALPLFPAPVAKATSPEVERAVLAGLMEATTPPKWACLEWGAGDVWWGFDSVVGKWIMLPQLKGRVRQGDFPNVQMTEDSFRRLPEHLRDEFMVRRIQPIHRELGGGNSSFFFCSTRQTS